MKKRTVKRIISLLLVLFVLFTAAPTAFAAKNSDVAVARVSYICYVRTPGHCWIYVENLTEETFDVGAYRLGAYDGVSIGTFGHTRYDGWGIYYNVEAYCQTTYGLGRYTSFTEEVTRDELKKLSQAILSYRNSWSYFRNCTSFAAEIWNSISDKKMSALLFPAFVRFIMIFRGCGTNTPVMKPVTADEVFRQKGSSSEAYLTNVSKRSLRSLL